MKESSDFQLLFQGDRCSLVIHEAFLDDAGVYKVVAINSGGEASSQCTLTVTRMYNYILLKFKSYIYTYIMLLFIAASRISDVVDREEKKEEHVVTGSVPKFMKLPTDLLVAEGENAIFECVVIGEPKPDLRWYSDDGEMIHNGRILVSVFVIYLAQRYF